MFRCIFGCLCVLVLIDLDVDIWMNSGTVGVDDFHTQMINTNFEIKQILKKEAVHAAFKRNNIIAMLPETHPAVRLMIKTPSQSGSDKAITSFIFATGQVIITGSKCGLALLEAHECVTRILDKELDNIIDPKKKTSTTYGNVSVRNTLISLALGDMSEEDISALDNMMGGELPDNTSKPNNSVCDNDDDDELLRALNESLGDDL